MLFYAILISTVIRICCLSVLGPGHCCEHLQNANEYTPYVHNAAVGLVLQEYKRYVNHWLYMYKQTIAIMFDR